MYSFWVDDVIGFSEQTAAGCGRIIRAKSCWTCKYMNTKMVSNKRKPFLNGSFLSSFDQHRVQALRPGPSDHHPISPIAILHPLEIPPTTSFPNPENNHPTPRDNNLLNARTAKPRFYRPHCVHGTNVLGPSIPPPLICHPLISSPARTVSRHGSQRCPETFWREL